MSRSTTHEPIKANNHGRMPAVNKPANAPVNKPGNSTEGQSMRFVSGALP
jgi:hypothetical protein